jgi:hypothetical protein
LTTPYLVSAKNTDNWCAKKGDSQRAFPLDVPMVSSSTIVVAADGECLTCGGFSLGETVHLRNFEFIADYFSGLSLSPRRGNEGDAFMGSTHRGASTGWSAMIEDSTEEFLMVSSGKGSFSLPCPRRHSMVASLAPVTTDTMVEGHPRHRCHIAGVELPPTLG